MQTNQTNESSAERTRLQEDCEGRAAWKKWGPYLSERQTPLGEGLAITSKWITQQYNKRKAGERVGTG